MKTTPLAIRLLTYAVGAFAVPALLAYFAGFYAPCTSGGGTQVAASSSTSPAHATP